MIQVVRAKLHGIRVTGADLAYHGSITLDPEHCERAGFYPLEFVDIWNKTTGARLSTYVIHGEPGSRCCVLNGAAARTCAPGDELIICASEYLTAPDLYDLQAKVLTFLPDNTVDQELAYEVFKSPEREYDFRVVDLETHLPQALHTYPNVDVKRIREALGKKGWSADEVEAFCATHFSL
ncbi:MAG: aspartate 1-decarboxylase [Planctomycetes bacterium]|nr:aspartate 1-decarboxylase [Planctomycetota bacterium]